MDTKFLYIAAIVIATISGAFYYFSGKSKKLEVADNKNMSYIAKDVTLTQTNDKGELYIKASADTVTQWVQSRNSKLDHLNATMYDKGRVNATFSANQAFGYNNEKVVFTGNVIATKMLAGSAKLDMRTQELTGYPESRELQTNQSVMVSSPQTQFVSQGLKANLTTGQYEFFNIRGKYAPHP